MQEQARCRTSSSHTPTACNLEAELINAGLAPGTERTVFSKALDESFNQVDYLIANYVKPGSAGAAQTVPTIATLPATATYKTGVLAAYNEGNAAKKLEYIMTEKWINRDREPGRQLHRLQKNKIPGIVCPFSGRDCYKRNQSGRKSNARIKRPEISLVPAFQHHRDRTEL